MDAKEISPSNADVICSYAPYRYLATNAYVRTRASKYQYDARASKVAAKNWYLLRLYYP